MRILRTIIISIALLVAVIPLQAQQWAVFSIIPRNAMLTVDGKQTMAVRNGFAQVLLDAGTHSWVCESPFYETATGEFEIKSERIEIRIDLTPDFGYLKILTQDKKAQIYIDGRRIGAGSVESGRLGSGEHSVMLVRDSLSLYRTAVTLAPGEKKTVTIAVRDYNIEPLRAVLSSSGVSVASFLAQDGSADEPVAVKGKGDLNVHTDIQGVTVLINGFPRGTTPCIIKDLAAGQSYRVTLRCEGFRDYTKMVKVEEGNAFELNVKMKEK